MVSYGFPMASSSFMAQKPKNTSLGVASSQCPQQPAATAEVARPWRNLMEFTMQNINDKNRYRSDKWELEYFIRISQFPTATLW